MGGGGAELILAVIERDVGYTLAQPVTGLTYRHTVGYVHIIGSTTVTEIMRHFPVL